MIIVNFLCMIWKTIYCEIKMLEGSIHVISNVFFLANQGKISPSPREVQPPQQEFRAPNCSTLLLNKVPGARLHSVTKEFLSDFYCIRQFFC